MSRTLRYITVILLFALSCLFIFRMPYGGPVPLKENLVYFPMNIRGWAGQEISQGSEELPSHADDYLYRKYTNTKGVTINLYVGYWGKFRHDSDVFSGRHLISGYRWDPVSEEVSYIRVKGEMVPFKKVVYANGQENISVFYCYYTNYGVTTERFRGRFRNGVDAIVNKKTNVALIRIFSGPYYDGETDRIISDQIEFAGKMLPWLIEFFPFGR